MRYCSSPHSKCVQTISYRFCSVPCDLTAICVFSQVLEESNIVSDVTFVEGGDGSSSVVGQFVSTTGQRSFVGRGLPGVQRPTREITLANGRRRIAQLAQSLHLRANHIDAAHRLFMLAVQHNFTQGRRSQHVAAACLYIVCRRQKTPHMLIDFSDVLQVNVFVLGQTFLKLCQTLSIQPPVIDPSLYIHRFAAKLEFKEEQHQVSTTALRIVQRMNRDWMQTGRRPAGICGAALMIAGRLHGHPRTQKEIVNVVNICELTLRKRLAEFENTATASQTMEDFQDESKDGAVPETDPPAFRRARLMEELQQAKEMNDEVKIEQITEQIILIDRPKRTRKQKHGSDHSDDEDEEEDESHMKKVTSKKKPTGKQSKAGSSKKRKRVLEGADEKAEEDESSTGPRKSKRARKQTQTASTGADQDDDEMDASSDFDEDDAQKTKLEKSTGKKPKKTLKVKKAAASKPSASNRAKNPAIEEKLEIDVEQENGEVQNPEQMDADMTQALGSAEQIATRDEVDLPMFASLPDLDDDGTLRHTPQNSSVGSTQGTSSLAEPQNAQVGASSVARGDDEGNFDGALIFLIPESLGETSDRVSTRRYRR